jgi:hypothetical protein
MTTPDVSYCALKKAGNMLPMYSNAFQDLQDNFLGNISIDCPMKPGKYYIVKIEHNGEENQYENPVDLNQRPKNGFGVHLPNGRYRFTLRVWTKADPNAFFAQWHLEIHIRLHEDNF